MIIADAQRMLVLREQVRALNAKIEAVAELSPMAAILRTITGFGPVRQLLLRAVGCGLRRQQISQPLQPRTTEVEYFVVCCDLNIWRAFRQLRVAFRICRRATNDCDKLRLRNDTTKAPLQQRAIPRVGEKVAIVAQLCENSIYILSKIRMKSFRLE